MGIARALAGAGYRVAIGYQSSEAPAKALEAELEGSLAVRLSLEDAESVEAALEEVRASLGEPRVLVNNAAIAQEKPFEELSDADWSCMFEVNLMGAVRLIRGVLPAMQRAGFGRIVNVSSIGGQWGGQNQIHYAASKAALINLTRSIAKVYSKDGITCNALAPGLVATEMSAAELESEAGRAKVSGIPVGRLGTVEEVGAAVVYLASPEAGYVSGQTLNLNGGMYFDA